MKFEVVSQNEESFLIVEIYFTFIGDDERGKITIVNNGLEKF